MDTLSATMVLVLIALLLVFVGYTYLALKNGYTLDDLIDNIVGNLIGVGSNFSQEKTNRLEILAGGLSYCGFSSVYSPFRRTPAFGTNEASNVDPSGSNVVPGRKGTDME